MADVAADLKNWSTTASSNSPTDSTTVGAGLADNLQEMQKVVRQDLAHKGADIASAGTTDIGAVAGSYHDITGTTTITGLGTVSAGISKTLQFDGALTITHNATSLILPGGANIITAAGDHMRAMSLGSGNWVVPWYQRANGGPVVSQYEHKNAIDNADFQVWQRGTGLSSGGATITADRWTVSMAGGGVATINRSATVPTVAQAGRLVPYSLHVDVTVADSSVASSDAYFVFQSIEGYRWVGFAQQTLTLSFWVRSTVTGTYCIALSNNVDRSWVQQYTINAADTWEFKTLTITASPSAGTWDYTTNTGASLVFVLASGSTYHGTNTTWNSSAVYATSSQVNGMSSTANNFYLAGVQLERGSVATPFSTRPFSEELTIAQRYYCKSFPYSTAPAQNAGTTGASYFAQAGGASSSIAVGSIPFPVRMRATPTVTLYNPSAANAQIRNSGAVADFSGSSTINESDRQFGVYGTSPAGSSAGQSLHIHWAASADI